MPSRKTFHSLKTCYSYPVWHLTKEVQMNSDKQEVFSKVPEVIWLFWIIKILATTLGETGGDALSMSLNLGYLVSTGIFAALFLLAVSIQIRAKISSGYLLGNHYCHHHRRYNAPFALDFFLRIGS